jgi:hypothetical protein
MNDLSPPLVPDLTDEWIAARRDRLVREIATPSHPAGIALACVEQCRRARRRRRVYGCRPGRVRWRWCAQSVRRLDRDADTAIER